MFLLYTTPIYAIVALMVVTVMYPVYKGIFTIGGVIDIIFPFCKITVILLILLSFQLVDITNIQPVLFENTGNVIKGILPGFHQFTGYGVITYILCYMQSSKGTFKWYIAGIIIPIVLYVTLTIVTIMVFTAQGVMSLVHPSLTLAKSIEFPTTFLERFESFIAVLWVGVVYESIVVFSFESVRNITVLLGISEKRQNLVAYGHIPLLIIIALVIRNGLEVMKYFNMTKYLMIPAALVIIPVLTGMALIKKKKEGKG